jgi:hypothetical protein
LVSKLLVRALLILVGFLSPIIVVFFNSFLLNYIDLSWFVTVPMIQYPCCNSRLSVHIFLVHNPEFLRDLGRTGFGNDLLRFTIELQELLLLILVNAFLHPTCDYLIVLGGLDLTVDVEGRFEGAPLFVLREVIVGVDQVQILMGLGLCIRRGIEKVGRFRRVLLVVRKDASHRVKSRRRLL